MLLLLLISVLSFLSIFKHKMYHGGGAQEVADSGPLGGGEVGLCIPQQALHVSPPGLYLAALAHVTALGAGRL